MAEGGWTAVGLSRDLEPGAVAGVIVDGREWALWRSESGRAHLWEDRCPHRGMRLSFGFVRGDRIGCLYHGWRYDEAGQCRFIPAHPELDVPATIRVTAYEVAESGAMLWAAFTASTFQPPTFSATLPVRSLYLDAALSDALKILSEMAAKVTDAPGAAQAKIVENDSDELLIAGHVVDERRSCLHITLVDPPAGERRARQKHHAKWAERLRRAVEAGR